MQCTHIERCIGKISNKAILVDTNLVISLANSISTNNQIISAPFPQRIGLFNAALEKYLNMFSRCTCHDMLVTSKQILEKELDPTKRNSSIVRNTPFLGDYYNYLSRVYVPSMQLVHGTIRRFITELPISDADITFLNTSFHPNHGLSPEDLSLLISTIMQANSGTETILVTADSKLEDKIIEIAGLQSIDLPSGRYSTSRMLPKDVYTYLCNIHECCEMSNDDNSPLFLKIIENDLSRMGEMSDRLARRKRSRMMKLVSEHERIVKKKHQAQLLGVV